MLDAFHVVALAGHAVDEVRRRVQQETLGHRGRSGDPLYGIRNVLRCAAERLTDKQQARLDAAIAADERHDAVHIAWQCAQRVRAAYTHPDPAAGRQLAEQVVDGFPSCPIPEIARLGRTLRQWKDAFLAYFDTDRASNGGTEAINGLIELHRRIARGFRNRENYRLRMLLIGGGLTLDPPQKGAKAGCRAGLTSWPPRAAIQAVRSAITVSATPASAVAMTAPSADPWLPLSHARPRPLLHSPPACHRPAAPVAPHGLPIISSSGCCRGPGPVGGDHVDHPLEGIALVLVSSVSPAERQVGLHGVIGGSLRCRGRLGCRRPGGGWGALSVRPGGRPGGAGRVAG